MTLDEAIKHAEEKAEHNYQMAGAYHTDEGVYLKEETKCRMCAEEHEQLAEWLKELQRIKKSDIISRQEVSDHLKNRLIQTAFNNTEVIESYDRVCVDIAENRLDRWLNEVGRV